MIDFYNGRRAVLAACLAAALPAFACEPAVQAAHAPGPEAHSAPETVAATAAAASTPVPGFGDPLPTGQLAQERGGDGRMAGTATLGGVVSANATNVVTGANAISAGSFAGAAGIPIVIQNSGANVLIQNATVINLQFK